MVDPNASRRGAFAVIAVFALGIVFGVALSFVIVHHVLRPAFLASRHGGRVPIERLARGLDLDPAQKEKVRLILERGHAKVRGALDETRRDIRAELHPDQQAKFDAIHPEAPAR